MDNQIIQIEPYKDSGMWVFDDPRVNLVKEPFVSGIPDIIELMLEQKGIENPEDGFVLHFSGEFFPDYDAKLKLERPEGGGNWYSLAEPETEEKMEGWICPALYKYYDEEPEEIFVKIPAA